MNDQCLHRKLTNSGDIIKGNPGFLGGSSNGYKWVSNIKNNTSGNHSLDLSIYDSTVIYHGTVLTVVSILGILYNVFILLIVLLSRKLRGNMANSLLCHLSLLGAINCTLLLPAYLSIALAIPWHEHHSVLCMIQGCVSTMLTSATLLTLTVISVDKYRTIAFPLRYSTRTSRQRLLIHAFIIWTPSTILTILPSLVGPGYSFQPTQALCDISYTSPGKSMLVQWGVSLPFIIITFYIPGSVIVCCYSRIFCIARGHRKRITAMLALVMLRIQAPITRTGTGGPPKEQKASRTIALFLGSFFLLYIPSSIMSLVEVIFHVQFNFFLASAVYTLQQCAPLLNTIIYSIMNRSLRQCLAVHARTLYSRHFLLNLERTREIRMTGSNNVGTSV